MSETETNKYLSLKTAAQIYGYTRDHLGLMIRQNKLEGTKLGSYYVTTNEWMTEYIKKYAHLNHPKIKNKLSNRFLSEALLSDKKIKPTNFLGKATKGLQTNPIDSPVKKLSDDLQNDLQNDLQKEILDAFSSLQKMTSVETEEKPVEENQKDEHFLFFEPPYLILPIRKMEENEKERIFKLLEQNSSKTDLV